MGPKVVITDSSYPDTAYELEELSTVDATVERIDAQTPAEVIERAADADALLNQETELTAEVFDALDGLRAVARYGVGVDNIDLAAADEHGVEVINVPSYCEEEVATHAMSLLLACVRRVPLYDAQVKRGEWDWKDGSPIRRLGGETVGFVAFGNIAQRFADLLSGFDLEFLAYDPYQSEAVFDDYGVESVSFEELIDRADIASIHAPLTEETRNLFDAETFTRMDDDALLINVARGSIVDTNALAEALRNDQIGGAGLDVLPEEPPGESPLFDLDDVVLTPHVAWYSRDSIEDLRRSAARGVAQVLRGETPDNRVVT
jgi:D-3-phosphoglycerate dehydrogenase